MVTTEAYVKNTRKHRSRTKRNSTTPSIYAGWIMDGHGDETFLSGSKPLVVQQTRENSHSTDPSKKPKQKALLVSDQPRTRTAVRVRGCARPNIHMDEI